MILFILLHIYWFSLIINSFNHHQFRCFTSAGRHVTATIFICLSVWIVTSTKGWSENLFFVILKSTLCNKLSTHEYTIRIFFFFFSFFKCHLVVLSDFKFLLLKCSFLLISIWFDVIWWESKCRSFLICKNQQLT